MNFIIEIIVMLLTLTTTVVAIQFDPPATDIRPTVVAAVALSTSSTFRYSYEIFSGTSSVQDIRDFGLKIGTTPSIQSIESPPGWLSVSNDIGTRGLAMWGGLAVARVRPGASKSGFVVVSQRAPAVCDSLFRGFVPIRPVEHVDENTPAPRDLEEDSVHILTVGPSTFTYTNPLAAVDRLISLKHEAVALRWLSGNQFVRKLDDRLDKAKDALRRDRPFVARVRIGQFIRWLEHERQQQERHPGRGPTVLTDNAFFLLKPNGNFIFSRLPDRPRDADEEREARNAERDDD